MSAATDVRPPPASTAAPGALVRRPSYEVRRTLLALLASALGVFPLCELFTDRGWLIDVWLTMLVVIAPAAFLRRHRPSTAAQVWVGVLLLIPWLTVNFVRQHAVLGLFPFAGAWHDVGRLMTSLHETTQNEVAPVHTTVAVRLAICALLGLVAALVDLLAVVGRRGALAGVPLLIVFTVSGAVPRQPVTWIWFVLSAAGFLTLLALDSSDDLQRWGHYVPRSSKIGRRQAARVVSGQRIAATAIVLAVVLPIFIPADSRNFVSDLFHPSTGTGDSGFGADQNTGVGTGGIDPFAKLKGELNREKKVDLLTVTSSPTRAHLFYLRTNVLSSYHSDGWRPGAAGDKQPINGTQFASSPGTPLAPRVATYSVDMKISGLRSNPPVFGSPTSLSGVNGSTDWSSQDMLLVGSRVQKDQEIHEDVAQPEPTVNDLRAAAATDPAMNPWLALPPVTDFVSSLTRRLTGKATTPYAKARALSDYFANPANGFSYSLQTANGDSGDDLTDFLTNKVGYCQQYAAAMGVMLRLAGVPARVVLGYAHDVPDAGGSFTVTSYDAHAWVEAYFSGIGWVPFDPTPLAGISGGSDSDLNWAPHGTNKPSAPAGASRSVTVAPSVRPSTTAAAPVAARHADGSTTAGLLLIVAIVLGVVVVLLLIPAVVRWRRRRHRLRLARHGDTDALWAELSDSATDLGYVWSAARTPRQVASWLGGPGESASGSLQTLTAAVERARYAPPGAGAETGLVHDLTAVEAGLRSRRGTRDRLLARFWPASLGWTQSGLLGRWTIRRR